MSPASYRTAPPRVCCAATAHHTRLPTEVQIGRRPPTDWTRRGGRTTAGVVGLEAAGRSGRGRRGLSGCCGLLAPQVIASSASRARSRSSAWYRRGHRSGAPPGRRRRRPASGEQRRDPLARPSCRRRRRPLPRRVACHRRAEVSARCRRLGRSRRRGSGRCRPVPEGHDHVAQERVRRRTSAGTCRPARRRAVRADRQGQQVAARALECPERL